MKGVAKETSPDKPKLMLIFNIKTESVARPYIVSCGVRLHMSGLSFSRLLHHVAQIESSLSQSSCTVYQNILLAVRHRSMFD